MPRICTSANDPLDFCRDCFPSKPIAVKRYGDLGDGPDARGNCFDYGADHPDYDGEDYRCFRCNKLLTANDNHTSRYHS